jgi:carbon-monoxide dehydrogenase small subunit
MPFSVEISFTLNGQRREASVAPEASALAMLRDEFDLTGAKLACGEGECGACTVIVDGQSVCSCILYAADLDGRSVETVEGLDAGEGLDPVQAAFVEHGAVQCGYCTPGMVMQIKHLLAENPDPDEAAIRRGLEGNVCRCTGYSKIIDAVFTAAQHLKGGSGS